MKYTLRVCASSGCFFCMCWRVFVDNGSSHSFVCSRESLVNRKLEAQTNASKNVTAGADGMSKISLIDLKECGFEGET